MAINRVALSGNLTRNPDVRVSNSGTTVMTFGLAVNDRRRNPRTGEWEDVPNFVDCTMFGSRGESVAKYLEKGSKVSLEGKLRYSSWDGPDGSKRSRLEVVVEEIEFLSRGQQQQQQQQQYQQPQEQYQPIPVWDEDIPF